MHECVWTEGTHADTHTRVALWTQGTPHTHMCGSVDVGDIPPHTRVALWMQGTPHRHTCDSVDTGNTIHTCGSVDAGNTADMCGSVDTGDTPHRHTCVALWMQGTRPTDTCVMCVQILMCLCAGHRCEHAHWSFLNPYKSVWLQPGAGFY